METELQARFNKHTKIYESCLIWKKINTPWGRGGLRIAGIRKQATHISWFLNIGEWPTKSVLHIVECRNSDCVKFEHLYQGTNSDNAKDMVKAGTHNQARKTHCKRGHLLPIVRQYGKRICEICRRRKDN